MTHGNLALVETMTSGHLSPDARHDKPKKARGLIHVLAEESAMEQKGIEFSEQFRRPKGNLFRVARSDRHKEILDLGLHN